jgi:hypothetical protein
VNAVNRAGRQRHQGALFRAANGGMPQKQAPPFEAGQRPIEPDCNGGMAAGIGEARHELELTFRGAASFRLDLERKTVVAVPDQQIGCTGENAHASKLVAGACVTPFAIWAMQPQHAGPGTQPQMFHNGIRADSVAS